jgi:formylglycine-generating enzyme required for sulfatase activity
VIFNKNKGINNYTIKCIFNIVRKNKDVIKCVSKIKLFTEVNNNYWRQPEGPRSSIIGKENHPVVHVSWFDAGSLHTGFRTMVSAL